MSGFSERPLSRRDWLRLSTAGVLGSSLSGWLETLASDVGAHPQRKRSCILLWMGGGPSQLDTFDLKPGHANGGPFKPIATRVPGIQISEHLPQMAKFTDHMAIVRSLNSPEGDHPRASLFLRTGYLPDGPIEYPPLGALVSKELGDEQSELPSFVSVSSGSGSGFLGPRYAPLVVGSGAGGVLGVEDLAPPAEVAKERVDTRLALLRQVQRDFLVRHSDKPALSNQSAYERAIRLMRSTAAKAFDLDQEKAAVRDAYGRDAFSRNPFGQGCLLARRLIERGVPFVEVAMDGWDTHAQNASGVQSLSQTLDPAWSSLMGDLKDRGLLETTLIVWMGEFGRTPKINRQLGRDHWPNSFSAVLAGGGIKGGQVIGATDSDGVAIKDRPVTVPQFFATICQALGIDHQKQNLSNVGRPIRIVAPGTKAVQEALS
jgi:Protein of unknown function (DUF1501)